MLTTSRIGDSEGNPRNAVLPFITLGNKRLVPCSCSQPHLPHRLLIFAFQFAIQGNVLIDGQGLATGMAGD